LIVSRGASVPYLTAVIGATYGIIFMGIPHAGADLAVLGESFTKLANILNKSNSEIVRVLEPSCAMLASVQQGFHTMLEKRRTEEAKSVEDVLLLRGDTHTPNLEGMLNAGISDVYICVRKTQSLTQG
jgi:hypothetical protein